MASQNAISPPVPRNHGGKMLLLVVLAAVLVVTIPLAVWVYRSRRYAADKKVLDEQIARIRAAGDPLTLVELNALYRIPAGETDLTDRYIAALRECEYDIHTAGDLPIVGLGDSEIPVPPQPWPQLEQAESFVSQLAEPLAQLKSLAKQRGVVRYPTELDHRKTSEELHITRNACRVLALETSCHAHRGNHAAASDCVIAIGGVAETFRHQPQSVAHLVRAALWGIAHSLVNDLVSDPQFPLAELERLQRHYEASRWDDGYVIGLLGDRVTAYEVFRLPLRDSFQDKHLPGTELHQVLLRTQPRECGEALEMLSDLIDAARSSPESLIAAHETMNNKLRAALARGATPSKGGDPSHRRQPNETLPFMMVSTNYWFPARHRAEQRTMVVVLAVERYRREQGQLPAGLEDLVPEYLDQVPADPFDGKPLRFIQDGTRYTVYSVGVDLNDDSGAVGYAVGSPKDIGVAVPRWKE